MGSKTRIIILQMKEIIYTIVFVVLALLMIFLFIYMFFLRDKRKIQRAGIRTYIYSGRLHHLHCSWRSPGQSSGECRRRPY